MNRIIGIAAAAIAIFCMAGTANALILSPSNTIAGYGYGPSNCEPNCVETVFGLDSGSLSLLYKANAGGTEEGSYSGSYFAAFYNTLSDPSNALIGYDLLSFGPAISCAGCYLAIKDGNSSPGYYFYDLSSWNGVEWLSLENFWPGNVRGAISHVSIWGTSGSTNVPEPSTVALLGIGLLGAGLARRRRKAR